MSEYSPPTTYGAEGSGASTSSGDSSPVDDMASAKDKATDAAQAGKQAASEVAQTATDAAKDVAQQTASHAKELAGKTGQQVNEQAGVQKSALVDALRSVVDQLGGMTEDVKQDGIALEVAGKARDSAASAADWLDERDPGEVLEGIRSFGRERPAAYLFGALAAGVVAGRLTRGVVAVHTDDDTSSNAPGNADTTSSFEGTATRPRTLDAPSAAGRHGHEGAPTSGGLYSDSAISSRPTPGYTP